MITTYIHPSLIEELEETFPNQLPDREDYFGPIGKITPEQIAFKSGVQHVIHYLKECAEIQKHEADDGDVKIKLK